jgi:cytochrome c-type biogenesis protein CcmF
VISFLLAQYIQPLQIFYDGTGVTSGATRRNFYLLNMLLGGTVYFSLSSLLYALPIGRLQGREKAWLNYIAPVGLIHMGVMIGLFAALCATILDSNSVRKITFPAAYDQPITISDHLSLHISRPVDSIDSLSRFRAVTGVTLRLRDGDRIVDQGQTLYEDARKPVAADIGPIRQYCEAVDYRFARMSRDRDHMLNPYIYRGLGYDLQVWLPAVNYPDGKGHGPPIEYNMVIKKFPMMMWLWIGLGLSLLAGAYYAIFSRKSVTTNS